uniref:Nuclear respiratory factor 1 n=1 Tax=Rousettus aegyptiacus TaxID=9407 RepID=A0A7J8D7Z1_ROUAE|nr:nuclear respiratory factor 1 [Rousettus aegyptiacus]
MEEHGVTQTEHMATIEAHAVAQQVQQVHVATYPEHSMLSADEDSPSSPEDTSYDDSDILNSTAADEVLWEWLLLLLWQQERNGNGLMCLSLIHLSGSDSKHVCFGEGFLVHIVDVSQMFQFG